MSLFNIFFLHLQQVFYHRLRSLVWFFIPLMNNLTLILFWSGALKNTAPVANWNMSYIATYYFLLTIAEALLSSHIEEDVASIDIQQGYLVRYLLRPFPYYWIKCIEEVPYRLLQGSYGVILLVSFSFIFSNLIHISSDPIVLGMSAIIFVLAYFLSYTMKINLGLSAFWFIDSRGFFELFTIILIIFSGGIVPLHLFPAPVQTLSYILPFAYSGYFPIIALQGQLGVMQLFQVMGVQIFWLGCLLLLNRTLWNNGIKQFTAFGQ
jgi:ABC-2 type transport system permease protein